MVTDVGSNVLHINAHACSNDSIFYLDFHVQPNDLYCFQQWTIHNHAATALLGSQLSKIMPFSSIGHRMNRSFPGSAPHVYFSWTA